MPRLPRDLSGRDLAHALRRYGYHVTPRPEATCGSPPQGGEHHVSIPDHASLRVGTLAGLLADVATHLKFERPALATELFERG